METYYLKRDIEVVKKTECSYNKIAIIKAKRYTFDESLKEMGKFTNTEHRRVFIYAMLESNKFEKECNMCGVKVKDWTKHGIEECAGVEKERKVFKLRMKLYNVDRKVKLLNKTEVLKAALMKRSLMKVVCEFLLVLRKRNMED